MRLTCPIEVKQMNWTQVRVARFTEVYNVCIWLYFLLWNLQIADFLEKMAELEKGEKVSVGKRVYFVLVSYSFLETVLFTVSDVATYRESSGIN